MNPIRRVAVIEPFCGGSHRHFVEGLGRHLPYECTLLTLPARQWKWRMRLAAPHFARQVAALPQPPDLIFCASMLDVACFRALLPRALRSVPILTYFHENQFAYPVRRDDERDAHFALTNLTTALAADRVVFNSRHNLDTFLAGGRRLLPVARDVDLADWEEEIRRKSEVIPPGLDFFAIDAAPPAVPPSSRPIVLWNHRWEHDKAPEVFFQALFDLDEAGIDFALVVLGESFEDVPPIFHEARQRLARRILHFGHVESRDGYCRWLKASDFVASTARHEFFGMAVVEAARAGCRPFLPRRLSYPELFGDEFLYDDKELAERLAGLLKSWRPGERLEREVTERFSWTTLGPAYQATMEAAIRAGRDGGQPR